MVAPLHNAALNTRFGLHSIFATPPPLHVVGAALAGSTGLSVAPGALRATSSALAGSAAFTVSPSYRTIHSADLAGASAVSVEFVRFRLSAGVSLSGGGTITVSGGKLASGEADLVGSAVLYASGCKLWEPESAGNGETWIGLDASGLETWSPEPGGSRETWVDTPDTDTDETWTPPAGTNTEGWT